MKPAKDLKMRTTLVHNCGEPWFLPPVFYLAIYKYESFQFVFLKLILYFIQICASSTCRKQGRFQRGGKGGGGKFNVTCSFSKHVFGQCGSGL